MGIRGLGLWLAPAMLLAQDPVLVRYCLPCHNAKLKTAALSLEGTNPRQHPRVYEKVVRRLMARQMPPSGLPRPSEDAYRSLVATLTATLDAEAAAHPNPGRTETFRRLTRVEYRNAIRDLLAIDADVAELLPRDDASHGFDNVTTGELSPTLLERYLIAARRISRLATGTTSRTPGGETVTLRPDLTQERHVPGLPAGTRGGVLVRHTFPLDGEYEIRIRLARDRNEYVEGLRGPHEVEILVDGERVKLFTVEPPRKGEDYSKVDLHLFARVPVTAGPHAIGATFPQRPFPVLETERQPYEAHFNMDRHPRLTPAVYSVTINGPYAPLGPGDTPSRRRIFSCSQQDDTCAQQILLKLARRAFRRPVNEEDIRGPIRFYRETRPREGFENAVEMGLRAILVSPEFLFRIERDPDNAAAVYPVSDLQLASRLAFFLWSSIPDDELLDAAEEGTLRTPAVLERQVRRMLADPRSQALVDNFAAQWLHLRNLEASNPDMRQFVDFDDNLRRAFRRETELFFETVMREDRSVLEFLNADYTFVDERLAKHYSIPNVYGSRFRKVQLGGERQRGGLLRHGSILTVTSYANRTSPVIRGKWVLDNILGIPPPPPPGAVPALQEKGSIGSTRTIRERLAEHRKNPVCNGCHQLMDPVGFALENYDAVGRWRVLEDSTPVDASGQLPDGTKFSGVEGLEKALLARPEMFATNFTEKLMTYALGRGIEHYDAPAVRRVVARARQDQFRFSSFILGITTSTPFLLRRTP